MPDLALPDTLTINAWTGSETPVSSLPPSVLNWGLKRHSGGPTKDEGRLLPHAAEEWDWKHPDIGWGLVLPDNDTLSAAERAGASDAPEPIQKLLAARHPAPVLRYLANGSHGYLRRYDASGSWKDISLVGSESGVKPAALPRFLLLYGGPRVIPWAFQYAANLTHFVGRLDLTGEPLKRYVQALLSDWMDADSDPRAPVLWSVSHGHPDITWLMDAAISKKLRARYSADPNGDLSRCTALFDGAATSAGLVQTLSTKKPSLVVTTSHGMTGPLDNPALLVAQLGIPVDVDHKPLDIGSLVAAWEPSGAIWYSHACCSAGSDAPSCYAGLLDPASEVVTVLRKVAEASGARVAPLPNRLLGAAKPLRAFVGHVEPTFDWTLRDPWTAQPLTSTLQDALYDRLYSGAGRRPLGWALQKVFQEAGSMFARWAAAIEERNAGKPNARESALYNQLSALDRQHTVILGDPTVALPAIDSTPK